jgi:hypothetical protein
MKYFALLPVLAGLCLGWYDWQVNNLLSDHAQAAAQAAFEANPNGRTGFGSSYNPVSLEDRAIGMSFAFLLCGVGCSLFASSTGRSSSRLLKSLKRVDDADDERVS